MDSIYDLVSASAIVGYVDETIYSNELPMLGEALFPRKKKLGLDLAWFKGYNLVPVSLMPSAFDAKPTIRDRIGLSRIETEMPFFREAMRLGEKDRQEILKFQGANNVPYLQQELDKILDDRAQLVAGADVVPERMRMSLLVEGRIHIQAPDESGITANYDYNYDPTGEWADKNTFDLTESNVPGFGPAWSDTENSRPILDLIFLKRKAQMTKGTRITRGIMTSATWALLLASKQIQNDLNPENPNAIITDADLENYLFRKIGIRFTLNDKIYKTEEPLRQDRQYYPNGYITLLPEGTLGNTYYGTTPEEADLMAGNVDADVAITGVGIAVLTKKESLPVNIITSVSQIVLPSFERMDSVYTIKVADMKDDPAGMLPEGDGADIYGQFNV